MFVQKLAALGLVVVVASGLSATVLLAEPASTRPDQPPRKAAKVPLPQTANKLLFFRGGRLILIDPDGKNEKVVAERLAGREMGYGEARLSPDGKTVAFLVNSRVPGPDARGIKIWLGKLFVRVLDEKESGTDLQVKCKTFAWSPDGSEIAFSDYLPRDESEKKVPPVDHFIIDAKSKKMKGLKLPPDHLLTDWSPDGKYFLTTRFVTDPKEPEAQQARLYLMNRDGSEHKALTDEKQFCTSGRLSPDGKRVLYHRATPANDDKGQPKGELVILDIVTGKSVAVGPARQGEILGSCWSPDGKRIAYTWRETHKGKPEDIRDKETESQLVVCDADGKNAKTIASEKGANPWGVTIGDVDWR